MALHAETSCPNLYLFTGFVTINKKIVYHQHLLVVSFKELLSLRLRYSGFHFFYAKL